MTQWVYRFSKQGAEGDSTMLPMLGGKGANLAEMCHMELPVPPGFTISTAACNDYYQQGNTVRPEIFAQAKNALRHIEQELGLEFGDAEDPLLISVRSGARASMPGMMDTILNLGLNDETVEGLARKTGNARFAYDSYRRFIQMYGSVVLGINHGLFEDLLEDQKANDAIVHDTDLSADSLKSIVEKYKALILEKTGEPFIQDVYQQLYFAVQAVFSSWMNDRAKTYRRLHDIPEDWGTAVNVQAMVFGNMGETSATGVAFTRDPSTGERRFFGEFLINAQGEDVVAGIRTPHPLTLADKEASHAGLVSMEEAMPEVFAELVEIYKRLESHYADMQDIEFTVQNKKLYILQTRSGKRTAYAAVKIAVDMVEEGLISKEEAISRVDPASLDQLLHPRLDPNASYTLIQKGLPASPGAISGVVSFSPEDAERRAAAKQDVVLVRVETSPEDIQGMIASKAILTSRGGMTSHAAVVARGMGKSCVCGATSLHIDYDKKILSGSGITVKEGEIITVNGSTGEVILGHVPTIQPELTEEFKTLMGWADEVRRLRVRANAETPEDALVALKFGAEGIGLCRTEHMFFDAERIPTVRRMILASTLEERLEALDKLLPMQRGDFIQLFETMNGAPVTIRLLDPPLHEFLPHSDAEMEEVAKEAGLTLEAVRQRALRMEESNPMLGHRGCRLGISYPEIYEMQARAIFEAAIHVEREKKLQITPEIMIPLVISGKELEILKAKIEAVAAEVFEKEEATLVYHIGTMIELPRAALRAGDIAHHAGFFSFGTNDLTQTTFGISRDDSATFLDSYHRQGILEHDPFVRLDEEGVGELIAIAADRGRAVNRTLKLGICGEHGGHPAAVHFCNQLNLDYVSCSPYRVPIARLAAAQSALKLKKKLAAVTPQAKAEAMMKIDVPAEV